MHTGQIILVKAEDHEDAISKVNLAINADGEQWFASNWSDWAVVANEGMLGSRWTIKDFFDHEDEEGNEIATENEWVVSYETERKIFDEVVQGRLDARSNNFDNIIRQLKDDGVDSVYDFQLDQDNLTSWNLRRLANLANSIFNSDSMIFDLENFDANLKWFKKEIEDGVTNWYAVVVDFHF